MSCEQYLELISGHIDGENSEAQERALQAHLEHCAHCRALLESYRQMEQGIAALTQEVPEGFAAGVLERLPVKRAARRRGAWLRPLFGAAAAALVLLIGLRLLPEEGVQEQKDALASESAVNFLLAPMEDSESGSGSAGTTLKSSGTAQDGAFEGNPYTDMYDWIEQVQTPAEKSEAPRSIYASTPEESLYSDDSLLGWERNRYPVLCIYGLKQEFVRQLADLPRSERSDGLMQYSTTYAVLEEVMHEYTQYVSWSYPSKDDTPREDDPALIVWFPLDFVIPAGYIY